MSKASNKQVREYIENGGVYCLYCGSSNLNAHNCESEEGIITQYIECDDCNRDWTDVCRLVGVREDI